MLLIQFKNSMSFKQRDRIALRAYLAAVAAAAVASDELRQGAAPQNIGHEQIVVAAAAAAAAASLVVAAGGRPPVAVAVGRGAGEHAFGVGHASVGRMGQLVAVGIAALVHSVAFGTWD